MMQRSDRVFSMISFSKLGGKATEGSMTQLGVTFLLIVTNTVRRKSERLWFSTSTIDPLL